jgi:hypothetical protein
MSFVSGSFRDPSGSVFIEGGQVYRTIFEPGVADFEAARDEGIYDDLIDRGLLISHKEVHEQIVGPEGAVYCLNHQRLPMISYPWEWPFSVLKEAALIHLDIMERLLPQGFWLRDANAFNVQYDGERLRLIDTLSIGRRPPDSPWVAYGQFCSHFLAPLAVAAYCDIRTFSLWRNYMDGFPLDLACRMLPWRKRYLPGLFMHLALHARFQEKADQTEDIGKKQVPKKSPKVSDRGLIGLVRSLRRTVKGISWKPASKIWGEYGNIRTYNDEDVSQKSRYVEKVVKKLSPDMVWDLGANTGEFSLIAASHGAFVVSIEGDPACTEMIYQKVSRGGKHGAVLPLTMDVSNPSPGLGWDGAERPGLRDRGPADLVFALALIHHLVFTSCVPLSMIAEWFSRISTHLLIEFVPLEDPMVQKLLMNRRGEHHPYDPEIFRSAFGKFFSFLDEEKLRNGRTLFLCKRKDV